MKKILLLLVFNCVFHVFGQENTSAILLSKDSLNCDAFYGVDAYQNLYYKKNNVFYKKTNNKLFEYKNLNLGEIYFADHKNPLKIVLFYKNFNRIALLDNQLNEIKVINFNEIESSLQLEFVGLANQNSVWIFDSNSKRIGLFNFNTNNLKYVSTPIFEVSKFVGSDFNNMYWTDEEHIFYSISIYGKIKNLGKIPDFEKIQLVDENNILYSIENELFYYKIKEQKTTKIELEHKIFSTFYFTNTILSIENEGVVWNYKLVF